ncbi:MAG: sigma-70 family RNA polymerase sigma factor [Cyanobacteria bacterium]|nr:sigma-70 family RNA polymerase sigma factor [Cyanobacteriota bacterium]
MSSIHDSDDIADRSNSRARANRNSPEGMDQSDTGSSFDASMQRLLDSVPDPSEFLKCIAKHVTVSDVLKSYLSDIARLRALSTDEEQALLGSLQAGGQKEKTAKKKLNESYLRLVAWVAKEYTEGGSIQLLDLINEGAMGLMHAVNTYDEDTSMPFSQYATLCIKHSIAEALSEETRLSRVPAYLLDKVTSIKGVTRSLSTELGREPSRLEIADAMGLSAEELERLVQMVKQAPQPEEEPSASEEGQEDEDASTADYYEDFEDS